jgi:hypothetical protein
MRFQIAGKEAQPIRLDSAIKADNLAQKCVLSH